MNRSSRSARPNVSQFLSRKIRRSTFLNNIKFLDCEALLWCFEQYLCGLCVRILGCYFFFNIPVFLACNRPSKKKKGKFPSISLVLKFFRVFPSTLLHSIFAMSFLKESRLKGGQMRKAISFFATHELCARSILKWAHSVILLTFKRLVLKFWSTTHFP